MTHIAYCAVFCKTSCGKVSDVLGDLVLVENGDRSDIVFVSASLVTSQNFLVLTVASLLGLDFFHEVAGLRGHVVAALLDSSVCVAAYEGGP